MILGGFVAVITGSFTWALVAIAVGTGLGALLIALHGTQGPHLGVPQTVQSGAQFRFYGVSFLYLATLFLNVGFAAAIIVEVALAFHAAAPAVSVPGWIVITAVAGVPIGVIGYRLIHRIAQATAVLVGAAVLAMLGQALAYGRLPAAETSWHLPPAGLFIARVALLVIDMLSFGPFVSDYTRYVSPDVRAGRIIGAIWWGNVLSTVLSCAVGAYLAALLPKDDPITAIGVVCGGWALVVMGLSLVGGAPFNSYTGSFQILALRNLTRGLPQSPSRVVRLVPYLMVMAAGTVLAFFGYTGFVTKISDFLDVLIVIFIPWSAVNLADWFFVRRGHYDAESFFTPRGIYGGWAWQGLTAYAIGLAAEFPFANQPPYYVGVLVAHLGGADISWIVGFFVAAGAYLLLTRLWPVTEQAGGPRPAAGVRGA